MLVLPDKSVAKKDVEHILRESVTAIEKHVAELWLKGEKVSQAYADRHFNGKRQK